MVGLPEQLLSFLQAILKAHFRHCQTSPTPFGDHSIIFSLRRNLRQTKSVSDERTIAPGGGSNYYYQIMQVASQKTLSAVSASKKRINLRSPDIMAEVQSKVESHYRSLVVEHIRRANGVLKAGSITVRLAKEFGFCYGVERAIDLAYAARKVFPSERIFILGEIIHNPDVNAQISNMGIVNLIGADRRPNLEILRTGDVVIVPAFGAEAGTVERIKELGCNIVDTTCGDVMSVWKRVRQNASDDVTSIIHGKADHEETRATASRALGRGSGHFLILLNIAEADIVCQQIRNGGPKEFFLERFKGAYSKGFDPDIHLRRIGVANQTTMLRSETEEIQRRLRAAIIDRDGPDIGDANFRYFDTICGATQERQDALFELLREKQDLLLVVGGYNSSNTTHLAEIGSEKLPTYFILNASRIESHQRIRHFDFHRKTEVITENWLPEGDVVIGLTAGASCPNNLIEETILRLFSLRGIGREALLQS